ncbi:MAG: hypothetical protein IKL25_06930 [Clostridia bacterium]|nr:hypothetical protein [Clostridia bacterium]
MQNPSNQNQPREKKESARRNAVWAKIKSLLFDNLGIKLLSLFIAVALWAGLITQDPTLTREKQFDNVDVNVIGADTLRRNGFIVLEDMDVVMGDVSVRTEVPQAQYTTVQASNYSIRIDLSRIRSAGVQEVKILSTNSATYGTVTEISPAAVTLTVDEYVTRYRIPVTVVPQGEPPEGFYASQPSTDPPMIAVSGPRTLVEGIVCAQVAVDQSALPAREGVVRQALAFVLVDENGAAIQSDMLQVTSEGVLLDSIIVEQQMYTTRTVEMSELGLVVGVPADGYEIKGIYITPATVTIAGREAAIRDMNILYADNTVNVNGLKNSVSKSLKVRQPSTIKYASTDSVTVAVEIGPVITTHAFDVRVDLQGLAPELREVGGMRIAAVDITGAKPWLNSLSVNDITLTCDLSSIEVPGTYTLPLSCVVENAQGETYTLEINPANVVVTVIQR